ncbi:triose-phosphate isomerase [Sulfurimonas sp. HSL-3221]|uniref:triose-phosphate isomerase n=1 Tax=Sulfurimonadaceae TaxID=2771471 RepID=UPI001E289F68|nr:triose-phosphate isomerase [Sulfurimonas sp. HSL-3221]UFS63089.1 triose-phosphate isomerase [Sulfurimonas sp. HSL-3221]
MIIAANFKTNHTRAATEAYLAKVTTYIADAEISDEVMVFPPATALCSSKGDVTVGAQNAWPTENGAYTGEIGTEQLDEFGIRTILIGHSERRHILGESQELVAEKFAYFKSLGYRIVYCIGEPLEVRDAGNEALMAYLAEQLEGIDLGYENLVVAYEPVWAIGTGRVPSENEIELIHGALAKLTKAPLLYGGSVKVGNAASILALKHVDGALVGSGALDPDDFCKMIATAKQINKQEV